MLTDAVIATLLGGVFISIFLEQNLLALFLAYAGFSFCAIHAITTNVTMIPLEPPEEDGDEED